MTNKQQQKAVGRALQRVANKNPLIALVVLVVVLIIGAISVAGGTAGTNANPSTQSPAQTVLDATLQEAEVVHVSDGDTLKVRVGDEVNYVRLVGMDTPESVAPEESRNCEEGVIASDYTKSLVSRGQTVWLSRDVSDTDQYGRWLRYVWLEPPTDPSDENEIANKMLNAILVREGYAQVKRYKPDTTLYTLFKGWGDEAIAEGKGVTHKWA